MSNEVQGGANLTVAELAAALDKYPEKFVGIEETVRQAVIAAGAAVTPFQTEQLQETMKRIFEMFENMKPALDAQLKAIAELTTPSVPPDFWRLAIAPPVAQRARIDTSRFLPTPAGTPPRPSIEARIRELERRVERAEVTARDAMARAERAEALVLSNLAIAWGEPPDDDPRLCRN